MMFDRQGVYRKPRQFYRCNTRLFAPQRNPRCVLKERLLLTTKKEPSWSV